MPTRIDEWMTQLVSHPDRHVGGVGNRAATDFVGSIFEGCGFQVGRREFDCLEWEYGSSNVEVGGEHFSANVGPYSEAFDGNALLTTASSIEELESEHIRGSIVLLYGEIAKSQIMPRNFTFYNPDSHRRIIRALDRFAPVAIVAATGTDPQLVGSQCPFPLFEDGDLGIPSAYIKDVQGRTLATYAGREARLRIDSRRVPTTAQHIVARLAGSRSGRIVLSAHIDSRKGSPGALDNASGVALLLEVATLVTEGDAMWTGPSLEFVPFNGEDNYANPGEMIWVEENEGHFEDIIIGINVDDLGMVGTKNHVSFYGVTPETETLVREVVRSHPTVEEGPQWFQSDHAIFAIKGRPALAMASSDIEGFMARYAHSERDTLELVDTSLIQGAANFLHEVISKL